MMPPWLERELPSLCDCGYPILDNERLTHRYCCNPVCPHHMGVRIERMVKALGYKGIGEKTAYAYAKSQKHQKHFEYIPDILPTKPKLKLEDFPKILQVEGIDKAVTRYLKGKSDIMEVFNSVPQEYYDFVCEMMELANYVEIEQLPVRSDVIYNVMVTGQFKGWPSRDQFLEYLNTRFGQYCQFHNVGVRKTGVDFLIREEDTPAHNKTKIAIERKIPMVTPAALVALLEYTFEGDENDISTDDDTE